MGPNWNPDTTQGKMPVRVMAQWDGNLTRNYSNSRNVRTVDHIHYGECDEDCCGAGPEPADA